MSTVRHDSSGSTPPPFRIAPELHQILYKRPGRSEEHTLNSSHLGISYAVNLHLHSFPTRRSSDLRIPPNLNFHFDSLGLLTKLCALSHRVSPIHKGPYYEHCST